MRISVDFQGRCRICRSDADIAIIIVSGRAVERKGRCACCAGRTRGTSRSVSSRNASGTSGSGCSVSSVCTVGSIGSRRSSSSGCAGRTSGASRKCSGTELAVRVDEDWVTAALINTVYSGDESAGLGSIDLARVAADADGVVVASNTYIANIDVISARGEVITSTIAQAGVFVAVCVVLERIFPGSCVVATGGVAKQRRRTNRRVGASRCYAEQRLISLSRIGVS